MPERIVKVEPHLENRQRDISRYRLTRLSFDDAKDTRRFQQWEDPPFRFKQLGPAAVEGTDFIRHSVGPGEVGRMDLIAFQHYRDENLWWVLATVNNIQNTFTQMFPGQQLLIPLQEDVIGTLTPES